MICPYQAAKFDKSSSGYSASSFVSASIREGSTRRQHRRLSHCLNHTSLALDLLGPITATADRSASKRIARLLNAVLIEKGHVITMEENDRLLIEIQRFFYNTRVRLRVFTLYPKSIQICPTVSL